MCNKILLFILNQRLNKYKKNAEWYHRQGAQPNWYDDQGIPDLEKDILELKNKIERG